MSTPVCSFYGHRRQLSCTPLHPNTNSYPSQNKNSRPGSSEHAFHNPTDDDQDDDDKLLAALAAAKPQPTAKTGHSSDNLRPNQDKDEFRLPTDLAQEDEFDANPRPDAKPDSAAWRGGGQGQQGEGDQLDAGVDEAIMEAEEEWSESGVELAEERARERWRRQGRLDEVRTWEACGKVVAAERKDFGEFVVSTAVCCRWLSTTAVAC